MTGSDWAIISLLIVNTIAVIAMVGKQRRPVTPLDAIVGLIINTALIAYIVVDAL